jgi:hypothetical protein
MVEYMNVRMSEILQTRNLELGAQVHNRKLSRHFELWPAPDVIPSTLYSRLNIVCSLIRASPLCTSKLMPS